MTATDRTPIGRRRGLTVGSALAVLLLPKCAACVFAYAVAAFGSGVIDRELCGAAPASSGLHQSWTLPLGIGASLLGLLWARRRLRRISPCSRWS